MEKEKEKLDMRVEDLVRSCTEANRLDEESRSQVAAMSVQLRDVRSSLEESDLQRAQLDKAKRGLEIRIEELDREYNTTSRARADMQRSVVQLDQQTIELRDLLDEHQEKAHTADERARRAEAHAQAMQVDLSKSGTSILSLKRQNELAAQLELEQREKSDAIKNSRKADRIIRELQFQLSEKEKQKTRADEEQEKMEHKLKKMRTQIEELETSESNLQLAKRRAEREAADFRERSVKFEKEVEKIKGRVDRSVFSP
ncbi:hypothetical protein BASA81_011704 [Batrachochytrium salamandrivorans]|nr:hypothetical protein BASA81_011704 [Batrachochytrium salamandrivorans]